ncbi:ABC transporter permease [Puia sp.]|uniref:ABC transporter permease n=1 Tax=Puia sp. TaxID=2045100 RepID=UPI002F3FEAFE
MVKKHLLYALRHIGRHKLNTTINLLGLTLGVLTCLVIYLFVSFEFNFDKSHPGGDRIYRVVTSSTNRSGAHSDGAGMTLPLAGDLRRETTGFTTVTGFYTDDSKVLVPLASGQTAAFAGIAPGERQHLAFVEPAFLDLFPCQWLAGDPSTALKNPFAVVLTRSEAKRYFGGEDPQAWMGRTLVYYDSLTVSVTGIVADRKQNSDLSFSDLLSYSTMEHSFLQKDMDGWNLWQSQAQAFVRLAPGVTPAQAEKQFPAFLANHLKKQRGGTLELKLQPLADIHFNGAYSDPYGRRAHKPTLYALIGIALFILLIASINFVNLSTAQAVQRAREVGVRKVLGGSRLGLTGQFLTETGIVVGGAMVLAVLLANPVISALHGFIPAGVHLSLTQPATLLFIAGTIAITGLLAGWYPARVLSGFLPVISLRGQGSQQLNSKSPLRKALIVFQFTISLLFIIATLVVGRQMHYVLNTDLGFNKDAILNIDLPRHQPENKKALLAKELAQLTGVQSISMNSSTPQADGHSGTFLEHDGGVKARIDGAGCAQIDTSYLPLYGLTLVAGHNIVPGDSSSEYLLNETAARALGFRRPEDAIGQTMSSGFGGLVGPVIGVVKDFHSNSYHDAITPFFFIPLNGWDRHLSIKLTAANRTPAQARVLLDKMEHSFKTIYPDATFTARFFDETIAKLYEREQKTAEVMNLAMAIAIFISCMGLFGLAAYTAAQRTREIGIRKVLGASVPHLVSLLSREFVALVLLSTGIAAPIAGWAMTKWLQDFAYRTSIPVWIYFVAGAGAVVIALLTVSFQAIRAATANPVESLRSE